ncbi:DUF4221 family protein [Roseivirga sp. E12]|uniref:DUF4221 family protein n=1 Tax=Roseivirga sp. E12 TaxID=2819237 RepID=UPI001F3810BA|nr:DUF4221 family protein [Roseivirga sp. E12]
MIELPKSTSSTLSRPALIEVEGVEYLIFYNRLDHSLSLINLSKRKYVKKIDLTREGPNFISDVRSMTFLTESVVLVESHNYLTKINIEGTVLQRLSINSQSRDMNGLDQGVFELRGNQYTGLQYSPSDSSIVMEINSLERVQPQKYRGSKLAKVYLDKRLIVPLDIGFPLDYSRLDGDYGAMGGIGYYRKGQDIVYNFEMSSDVFLSTNKTGYKLESAYTQNFAQPIKDFSSGFNMSRVEHQIKSLTFYPVIFDPNRKLYYRLHRGEVLSVDDDPVFYLIFSDSNFEKVREIQFPQNYYIYPIVSREGLMFVAFNKHDDKLELLSYKFEPYEK